MNHVISKNLEPDFTAVHRCVKSRKSQVAFARGFAAESSALIPRYHKILILCISSMVLFFVQGSTQQEPKSQVVISQPNPAPHNSLSHGQIRLCGSFFQNFLCVLPRAPSFFLCLFLFRSLLRLTSFFLLL